MLRLRWMDRIALKYFIMINGFTNILILVALLGKDNFLHVTFSPGTQLGLQIGTIIFSVSLCYLLIRLAFIGINDDKEPKNKEKK